MNGSNPMGQRVVSRGFTLKLCGNILAECKALQECYQALKPGGKIALLVSDSHAFKMVHIQTAKILQEIENRLGLSSQKSFCGNTR